MKYTFRLHYYRSKPWLVDIRSIIVYTIYYMNKFVSGWCHFLLDWYNFFYIWNLIWICHLVCVCLCVLLAIFAKILKCNSEFAWNLVFPMESRLQSDWICCSIVLGMYFVTTTRIWGVQSIQWRSQSYKKLASYQFFIDLCYWR